MSFVCLYEVRTLIWHIAHRYDTDCKANPALKLSSMLLSCDMIRKQSDGNFAFVIELKTLWTQLVNALLNNLPLLIKSKVNVFKECQSPALKCSFCSLNHYKYGRPVSKVWKTKIAQMDCLRLDFDSFIMRDNNSLIILENLIWKSVNWLRTIISRLFDVGNSL